jgi:ribosome maturation factor RimP
LLKKPADFARFAGHPVQLRSRVAIGNQRNFAGVLLGIEDGVVALRTDAGEQRFPLDQVDKARLVPQL